MFNIKWKYLGLRSLPSILIDFWPKNKVEFNRNKTVPPSECYCDNWILSFSVGFRFTEQIYHLPFPLVKYWDVASECDCVNVFVGSVLLEVLHSPRDYLKQIAAPPVLHICYPAHFNINTSNSRSSCLNA